MVGYCLCVVSVVICCLVLDTTAQNLCAKCTHVEFSAVPDILKSIFSATVLPTSPACSSAQFGQSAEGLSFVACPPVSQEGRPQRCVAFRGKLNLKFSVLITDIDFPVDIVYRDCLPIDPAIPSNCQQHNNIPTDSSLFADSLSGLVSQSESVNFVGTRCVSGGSQNPNSASSHKVAIFSWRSLLFVMCFIICACI